MNGSYCGWIYQEKELNRSDIYIRNRQNYLQEFCRNGINPDTRVKDLNDDEITKLKIRLKEIMSSKVT